MKNRQSIRTAIALALGLSVFPGASALAQNGSWISDANGLWTDSANWSGGIIANGTDNTAFFTAELTTATRNVTLNADRTIGNITFTDGVTSSNNFVINGVNTLTLDVTTGAPLINVTQSDRILAFDSVVAGNDGLTKIGQGTLAIRNASTYTGATTVNRGTFDLGLGSAIGSLASTTLNLGSGTFTYTRSGTNTQSFTTTNVVTGASVVNTSVSTNTLNLGSLSGRNLGATVTIGTTGTVTTTTGLTNGIIGGWAVMDSGTSWATHTGSGTDITGAVSYVTTITAGTTAANYLNNNIDMNNSPGVIDAAINANSLRFNDAAARTLTLNGTGTNIIQSGGILVTSTVGANASLITGGSLAGSASGDLIIHQLNTSSGLTIASNIVNNGGATALTKSGTGTLTLTGTANTYTGSTYVNQGILAMASNLIGTSPAIFVGNGASIQSSGSFQLLANQSITGFGAAGSVSTSSSTGVITAGNNIISAAGTLTLTRLSVLGTGNQITGGNIQSGGGGTSQRGLLVGNGGTGVLTITGGTLTSLGGGNYDLLGNGASGNGTLVISGGSYVNTATGALLSLGLAGTGNGTLTITNGSATITNLTYDSGTAGNGTVNLDGGTLTLSSITSTSGASRQFNFNGGQFITGAALTLPGTLTINVKNGGALVDTNGFDSTISGALVNFGGTSTGGLTKSGAGKLILSGSNSYAGATNINAGVVNIRNNTSLGSVTGATTVAAGAALELENNLNISVGAEALTLNGTGIANGGALRNISGANIYGGLLTLGTATRINSDAGSLSLSNTGTITGAGLNLTVGGAGNTSIASIIGTTTGSVIKDGSGALTLSGVNTFSGGLQVTAGTVNLNTSPAAAGTGPINFNTGGMINASVLVGTALTITNPITVSAGSTGTNTLGSTGNAAVTFNNALTLNNNLTLNNGGNAQLRVGDGTITGTGGLITAGTGTGVVVIAGANTYTGGFTLGGSGLIVPVGSSTGPDGNPTNGPFGAGSTPSVLGTGNIRATTGSDTTIRNTLTLAGNVTVPSVTDEKTLIFTGPATLTGNRTFTANVGTTVAGKSLTFAGAIGDGGNTFGLTKAGTGNMVLSAPNTYTGTTTVNGGTLTVTGNLANNGPASVLVATPDSTLAGNPIITRRVPNASSYTLGSATGLGSTAVSVDPDVLNVMDTSMYTTAAILNGTATGQADVSMQWRARTASEAAGSNPNAVLSNVLNLTGIFDTGTTGDGILDQFVLQMSYTNAALNALGLNENSIALSGELRLGWNDSGVWKTAALGNNAGMGTATFVGAVAYNPLNPAHNVLGAYGVDPSDPNGGVVWAVLNHNSEFAVIPEPSTLVLGGLALLGLAGVGLRRRRLAAGKAR